MAPLRIAAREGLPVAYWPSRDMRRQMRTVMAMARAAGRAAERELEAAHARGDLRGQLCAADEIAYARELREAAHGQLVVLRRQAGLRVGPEGWA